MIRFWWKGEIRTRCRPASYRFTIAESITFAIVAVARYPKLPKSAPSFLVTWVDLFLGSKGSNCF